MKDLLHKYNLYIELANKLSIIMQPLRILFMFFFLWLITFQVIFIVQIVSAQGTDDSLERTVIYSNHVSLSEDTLYIPVDLTNRSAEDTLFIHAKITSYSSADSIRLGVMDEQYKNTVPTTYMEKSGAVYYHTDFKDGEGVLYYSSRASDIKKSFSFDELSESFTNQCFIGFRAGDAGTLEFSTVVQWNLPYDNPHQDMNLLEEANVLIKAGQAKDFSFSTLIYDEKIQINWTLLTSTSDYSPLEASLDVTASWKDGKDYHSNETVDNYEEWICVLSVEEDDLDNLGYYDFKVEEKYRSGRWQLSLLNSGSKDVNISLNVVANFGKPTPDFFRELVRLDNTLLPLIVLSGVISLLSTITLFRPGRSLFLSQTMPNIRTGVQEEFKDSIFASECINCINCKYRSFSCSAKVESFPFPTISCFTRSPGINITSYDVQRSERNDKVVISHKYPYFGLSATVIRTLAIIGLTVLVILIVEGVPTTLASIAGADWYLNHKESIIQFFRTFGIVITVIGLIITLLLGINIIRNYYARRSIEGMLSIWFFGYLPLILGVLSASAFLYYMRFEKGNDWVSTLTDPVALVMLGVFLLTLFPFKLHLNLTKTTIKAQDKLKKIQMQRLEKKSRKRLEKLESIPRLNDLILNFLKHQISTNSSLIISETETELRTEVFKLIQDSSPTFFDYIASLIGQLTNEQKELLTQRIESSLDQILPELWKKYQSLDSEGIDQEVDQQIENLFGEIVFVEDYLHSKDKGEDGGDLKIDGYKKEGLKKEEEVFIVEDWFE